MARKGEARINYHVYSEEEVIFLRECIDGNMTYPQAAEAFNTQYGTDIAVHSIAEYCRSHDIRSHNFNKSRLYTPAEIASLAKLAEQCSSYDELYDGWCEAHGHGKTRSSVIGALQKHVGIHYVRKPEYSPEQDAWLRENGERNMGLVVEEYNARFGTMKTENALRCRMKYLQVDRSHAPIKGKTRFTKEMVEFLDSLPRDMNYAEMARQLNAEFGTKAHRCAVQDICCKRLGFKRTGNSGQFTKGQAGITNLNVGTERDLNGYVFIKIADNKIEGMHTYQKRKVNWVAKHRYIYEQNHGPIPKGWIVIFLDNDNRNFDPDNLYAVPRSIHARMCNNQWYTDSREHTLAAIKLCELDTMLRKGAIE